MNDHHSPRPEFVEALDWELHSVARRHERLSGSPALLPGRPLRIATLILVSMFLGAAGVVAAERIQDAKRGEVLQARLRILLEAAEGQNELVREGYEEAKRLQEAGFLGTSEWHQEETRFVEAEVRVARLRLDLEEVEITAADPSDSLSAPLRRGRDFVSERLALDERLAVRSHDQKLSHLEQLRALVERDFVPREELAAAETRMKAAEARRREIETLLAWRTEFLEGKLRAEQVDLLALRARAERSLEIAQGEREARLLVWERARQAKRAGVLSEADSRQAEQALREAEASVKLAELELKILREKLDQ